MAIGGHHIVLSLWSLAYTAILVVIVIQPYWCKSTTNNLYAKNKVVDIGLFKRCETGPIGRECNAFLKGVKITSYPGWVIYNRTVFLAGIAMMVFSFITGCLGNPVISFFTVNKKLSTSIAALCMFICGTSTLSGLVWFMVVETNTADLGILKDMGKVKSVASFWTTGYCVYLGLIFGFISIVFSIYAIRVASGVEEADEQEIQGMIKVKKRDVRLEKNQAPTEYV